MAVARTVRDVVGVARDRAVPFMAAAIAHYTLASIVPLVLLALAMAALLGTEAEVEAFVQNQLSDVLSGAGEELVVDALTNTQGAVGASVVSTLFAFWSASKVFRGFHIAFTRLYDVTTSPSLLEQLRDAAIVIGLLALVVGAMVAVGVVVSTVTFRIPFQTSVGTLVLVLSLVLGLLPIYYVLTPVDTSVRDVLPGAVLGAVGLAVLQILFVYYARSAGRYEALGALGGLLLFLTLLYLGAIVVLLGGAVNYATHDTA